MKKQLQSSANFAVTALNFSPEDNVKCGLRCRPFLCLPHICRQQERQRKKKKQNTSDGGRARSRLEGEKDGRQLGGWSDGRDID